MPHKNNTAPLPAWSPADDWEEKTVNERLAPRVTLAELHGVVGRLAREIRILSVVVAVLAIVTAVGLAIR